MAMSKSDRDADAASMMMEIRRIAEWDPYAACVIKEMIRDLAAGSWDDVPKDERSVQLHEWMLDRRDQVTCNAVHVSAGLEPVIGYRDGAYLMNDGTVTS